MKPDSIGFERWSSHAEGLMWSEGRFGFCRRQAMSLKSLSIVATAALALCAGAAQAATQNGFANGGFEAVGMSTPAESWLAANAGYTLSTDAHSGSYSAQLASPQFRAAIVLQNSVEQGGLPPLTVGDSPALSFWAKGYAGETGNVNFALRYLDGAGNIKADSQSQFFQGSINKNSWTEITYNLGAVPIGATAAFLEISQGIGPILTGCGVGGAFPCAPGLVLIDDVYLGVAAIPEPSSYAMMLAGLAALGFMARRSRSA
jgi:PEP-CTERM motif